MVGQWGPGMRQVVGFGDRSTGGGNFGGSVTNGKLSALGPFPKSFWDFLFVTTDLFGLADDFA